ncbi:hypothetical protein [Pontibacter amylolyticus]|uniref:Auto-transporter adhesin head GIN domain-containing protein n=1 Tax=Pontibacter amylolyticus TaxID=1424080 RepID=A0ABQ1WA95_9BACT|nr:hypothetical protein [Pontibacter amylolyticus]GGG20680.1 hypothetical protein GCM10011323_25860 [Pontibacter amylolyticus]
MKTSNKLLLFALVVLLGALGTYNIALKAEYNTKSYLDPYRNYVALDFNGFEEIELNSGDMLSVLIEPGDEHAVYLYEGNEETVQISQQANTLQIDVTTHDKQKSLRGWGYPQLIIKTPMLHTLRSNAKHIYNGEPVIHTKRQNTASWLNTTLKGFKQDSLRLELDNGVMVQLHGSQLQHLYAVTGTSPESDPKLLIHPDNKIEQANLDIRNRSHLALLNVAIPGLQYTLSEQAQVELSGEALAILRK